MSCLNSYMRCQLSSSNKPEKSLCTFSDSSFHYLTLRTDCIPLYWVFPPKICILISRIESDSLILKMWPTKFVPRAEANSCQMHKSQSSTIDGARHPWVGIWHSEWLAQAPGGFFVECFIPLTFLLCLLRLYCLALWLMNIHGNRGGDEVLFQRCWGWSQRYFK